MSDLATLAFEPGQQVQCKTRFDDTFKGEVVAFDLNSKILILKAPSSAGTPTNNDLHFLVLDSVSDKSVEILEEPRGKYSNDLPSIDTKYISAKQSAALRDRSKLFEAVRDGVSQDGISIYAALSKMFDKTSIAWKDKVKIVVQNSVIISPPYKEANCEAMSPNTEKTVQAVTYVKSNVRKYWDSCAKQK